MKNKLLKQASQEYNEKQRALALLLLAPIFLFLLPFLFVKLGVKIDQWMGLPFILTAPFNWIVGGLMTVLGWLFAIWSIYSQFTLGRGTPVPLMATQQLVVQPPFTYCRNPMSLGTFVCYLGVGILFHSYGAMFLVLLFAAGLIIYIKRVEEREMEIRFGQEYLIYKQRTPFLFPRIRKRA